MKTLKKTMQSQDSLMTLDMSNSIKIRDEIQNCVHAQVSVYTANVKALEHTLKTMYFGDFFNFPCP